MLANRTSPVVRPLILAMALALGTAHAAEPGSDDAEVHALLEQLSQRLEQQEAEIKRLRGQVHELEMSQRGRGLTGAPAAAEPAAQGAANQAFGAAQVATTQDAQQAPPADPASPVDPSAPPETTTQSAEPMQIGEARRDEDEERREQERALVVTEHAPLFERRFTFDSGLSYSYYDRRLLVLQGFLALDAIFLGTLNLDQTKSTVLTMDFTGRYGLTDRLSVEATVPYVYRDTRFVSGGAGGASTEVSEVQLSSSGIGDASIAAYFQVVKESQRWPDIVTSLRVRGPSGRHPFGLKLIQADEDNNNLNVPEDLPTGTGIWSVTGNVSALRTYDPVILFGNLGYTWNIEEDFDDISPVLDQVSPASVSLGNVIQISGGLAIALNDRAAVSFSVASAMAAATYTQAPGSEKFRIPGSSTNSTTLNIGATYAMPSGWTVNGQMAAGLTDDSPNFVFGLRASKSF